MRFPYRPQNRIYLLRHHCIAEGFEPRHPVFHSDGHPGRLPVVLWFPESGGPSGSVQPIGKPISVSTQAGLSWPFSPVLITAPGIVSRFFCDGGKVAFFPSCAAGVGHILTAVWRFGPPSPCVPAPVWQLACGVGHAFDSVRYTVLASLASPRRFPS